jgi:alpha-glucosidase
MRDFGYDVADYTEVDPVFGDLADFDRLIARAHALGLKVLIDQVWSHSSDQHPWFVESRVSRDNPRADWYVWADPAPDGTPPNNWLSVFGGSAWSWEPRRRQYYLHHFLASQPKLNLRHEATLEAILASGAFWLDRGVDGFRLDAMDFLLHDPALTSNPAEPPPPDGRTPDKPFGLQRHVHDMLQADALDLMRRIRMLTDRYPGRVTLAEISSQPGAFGRIAAYTEPGALDLAYTLALLKSALDAGLFFRALREAVGAAASFATCWAFGNHDVARLATRWCPAGADPAAVQALLMLLLGALPGTACVYQGDELGLPEAVLDRAELRDPFGIAYWPAYAGRDGGRTPMPWRHDLPNAGFSTATRPWLPVDRAHYARAVDLQLQLPGSPLDLWHRFLGWRRAHPALLVGDLAGLRREGDCLAFERRTASAAIFCAFNLSNRPCRMTVFDADPLDPPGGTAAWDAEGVTLPAWGAGFAALAGGNRHDG